MGSEDRFDITRHANGPNTNGAWPPAQNRSQQNPQASSRPSRENIIRNYNANAAMKARNARLYSQEAMQNFQEREERTLERQRQRNEYANRLQTSNVAESNPPQDHMTLEQAKLRARELRAMNRDRNTMTALESHDRKIVSKENFEAERAKRDVFSSRNASRSSNREVIDGRGSIDSRAFNERNELVGYSIDQSDRPDPLVETPADSNGRWKSQAGQGFSPVTNGGNTMGARRPTDLNKLSDTISGRSEYQTKSGFAAIPTSAKFLIVLIIILLGILIYLLFF